MMEPGIVRRLVIALLVTYIAVIGVAGGLVLYVNNVDQQSNREWCDLLTTLDSPVPPDNPRGRDVAAKISTLRIRLGCEQR